MLTFQLDMDSGRGGGGGGERERDDALTLGHERTIAVSLKVSLKIIVRASQSTNKLESLHKF